MRLYFWPLVAALLIANLIGFGFGYHSGDKNGYARREYEQALVKDEHDRVMRKVGLCKWAAIMADDIRCKAELP